MDNHLLAVLIHERSEPFEALKEALFDLSVEAYCVEGGSEAEDLIAEYQPLLVFVDLPIWSESHADIVDMVEGADQSLNIIVVGPLPDIQEHVAAIERGAFSFIAPPFSHKALTPVVHAAAMDARDRRESLVRVGLAYPST
jgi:DNA-binding NtrC family response regulator